MTAITQRTSGAPSRHLPAGRTLLRIETRLFLREPVGVVWGFVLPVSAFVVLGAIPALRTSRDYLGGTSFLAAYQPILILVSVTMLGLVGLPPILAGYRERGVLRRLQATPMPPSRLLLAQLAIHTIVAVGTAVVIVALGALAFGLDWPARPVSWAISYLLACGAMLGLGVLVAAVSPNVKIANTAGAALFFPLAFGAGLWIPRPMMPQLLRAICDDTPLGASIRAMTTAGAGQFPPVLARLALLAYAVVFCALAVRLFRWQ